VSNPPPDLLDLRARFAAETGCPLADIGIAADVRHLLSGGYHCGGMDLRAIGAVAHNDYSIRQGRDRSVYNADVAAARNWSSAMDFPDDWPRGGRAAWIRWNNLMRRQLGVNDPALVAVRGMNYSPDGTSKRRYDTLTDQESSTTDTVAWHTHVEWWRDTIAADQRRWATTRIIAMVIAARDNTPLDPPPLAPPEGCTGMYWTAKEVPDGTVDAIGTPVTNNSRVVATPAGVFCLEYGEIIDAYGTYPKLFLPMTWARLGKLCNSLQQPAQATLSPEQFADFKAGAVPIVHDAAQTGALAALESPEGQALLVQAANTAEDS